ncbi:unnamed protein product [Heligmosomoides polygyrus]|uniref:Uncharacterized protein n=1 Tax=Heligmosomoides polygyrus TaxID=6339 RepID=A0A183F2M2_HELPZ|nr:unnamed protein product [Heligmosomoides polygyrus]
MVVVRTCSAVRRRQQIIDIESDGAARVVVVVVVVVVVDGDATLLGAKGQLSPVEYTAHSNDGPSLSDGLHSSLATNHCEIGLLSHHYRANLKLFVWT